MMIGMTKAKIAVSLDPHVLARLRAAVAEGRAGSVSAFVERAVAGQLAAEADFDEIIAEMLEATGGPPTEDEWSAARRLLSGSAE
jgi:Arc/MetJ-type ribon-helix-helix transcriptional regulator